jgi:hypothetical protein
MKNCFLILSMILLIQMPAHAQRTKTEEKFIGQLNKVLKASSTQHWYYKDYKMTIESPFAIEEGGILSVTVRYTNDTSSFVVRTEGVLNKMEGVVQDIFLSLKFGNYMVFTTVYENGIKKNVEESELFFIGNINDDIRITEETERLWAKLKKYYPTE